MRLAPLFLTASAAALLAVNALAQERRAAGRRTAFRAQQHRRGPRRTSRRPKRGPGARHRQPTPAPSRPAPEPRHRARAAPAPAPAPPRPHRPAAAADAGPSAPRSTPPCSAAGCSALIDRVGPLRHPGHAEPGLRSRRRRHHRLDRRAGGQWRHRHLLRRRRRRRRSTVYRVTILGGRVVSRDVLSSPPTRPPLNPIQARMAAARAATGRLEQPALRRRGFQRLRGPAGDRRRPDRRLPDQPADPARPLFRSAAISRPASPPTAASPPRAASPMPASTRRSPSRRRARGRRRSRSPICSIRCRPGDPRLPVDLDRPSAGRRRRRSPAPVRGHPGPDRGGAALAGRRRFEPTVRAELVEALLLSSGRKEGKPFDRLRANGVSGVVPASTPPAAISAASASAR